MLLISLLGLLGALGCATAAPLTISNTLGSNMVLQRGRAAPIWGWDAPGAKVKVQFKGATLTATAGADGLWKTSLPAQPASVHGADIQITGGSGEAVVLSNCLFGDVLLCSGQSNMEFVLSSAINATEEIKAADNYPLIRVVDGPQQNSDRLPLRPPASATRPHENLFYNRMNWSVASSQTVGQGSDHCCRRQMKEAMTEEPLSDELTATASSGFSAICWFAARDLFDSLGGTVPIGAIDQSYGGTSIQFWMSADAIKDSNAPVATQCCRQDGGPSCLWNTQIYPYTIGPTQLRSVLWYQGEQNANCGGPTQTAGSQYSTMLQTMVRDWRSKFQQPDLLFGSCLLAPWKKNADTISFAELRIAQANLTSHVPNTFTVSTLDSGNPAGGQVHSPYKQAVGRRAAQGVAANASGTVNSLPFMPPQYVSSHAGAAAGTVLVKLAAEGLYGSPPVVNQSVACPPAIGEINCESFALLGSDCVWRNASATIDSASGGLLITADSWQRDASANGTDALTLTVVGSRAYYANWPVVQVSNTAGVPLLPWVEPLSPAAASTCPKAWPPIPTPQPHLPPPSPPHHPHNCSTEAPPGFVLQPAQGWWDNFTLVGDAYGSVADCAKACEAYADCTGMHVWEPCPHGDCYIFRHPLTTFAAHPGAFAYKRKL